MTAVHGMKCRCAAMEIKKVTSEEALAIIEMREPLGLFYTVDQTGTGEKVYVGIDNQSGDAWTEDFRTLGACKRWLKEG